MRKLPTPQNVFTLLALLLLFACSTPEKKSEENNTSAPAEPSIPELTYSITGLKFEGPVTTSSGWNTIRMSNNSAMAHFALLTRLPDSVDIWDHKHLADVFQNIMDNINGKEISKPDAGMEIPEWYASAVASGGPGLLSPGETSEVTVNLSPGNYVMECYVKSEGLFHSYSPEKDQLGMVLALQVDTVSSNAEPAQASVTVSIASEHGFEMEGTMSTGKNVVAVEFKDQAVYEHFLGHDIHLARLDNVSDTVALNEWMDWTRPDGLQTPSPVTFLGGTQDLPAGSTTYLTFNLSPGIYAWVAEIPNSAGHQMLSLFELE